MKYVIFLIVLAVTAFGWVDEDGRDSSIPCGAIQEGEKAIVLTIVDTFQVTSAAQMLGLDTQDGSSQLVLVDNTSSLVRAVSMGSGSPVWTFANPGFNIFGCVHDWPASYGWYANTWANSNMHYRSGSSWGVPFANPAGTYGRGMDYQNSGDYIWETYSSSSTHRLYRITDTGSSTYWNLGTLVPSQMSGLAVFPYNGNLGIFITCYGGQDWFLFEYTGSTMYYIGTGSPGLSSFTSSYGMTYHPDTDTFFWSYVVYGSNRWIAEISFSESSLQQSTWGSIKTQF